MTKDCIKAEFIAKSFPPKRKGKVKRMFENYKVFKTTFAGRELSVETGKTCGLANGSCWVRYGDTVVMVNVTASEKPRDGVDFFPLSVDYEEKLYAVGKIPGSFLKREGRPSEKAILTSSGSRPVCAGSPAQW